MDAILLQVMNGLDKGGAYALIALGLTLIFGTLGVVNFAHGALFMLGAFCAVTMNQLLNLKKVVEHPTDKTPWGDPVKIETRYAQDWFGDFGAVLVDYSVPFAILLAIPVMIVVGYVMERGLIRHFYKRPHADQILVTFGLAIVLSELVKAQFGATSIQTPSPEALPKTIEIIAGIEYPLWRVIYLCFSLLLIGGVIAFLQFTTFGMVVRAGMADRETVGLLGINIQKRFTTVFALAAVCTGLAGLMYAPIQAPSYEFASEFLVISFVVVVVGGMGSISGAVAAGFLLGMLQSFASMNEVKQILPGIDQIIIYLIAVVVLFVRPRGLMGRKGVMES